MYYLSMQLCDPLAQAFFILFTSSTKDASSPAMDWSAPGFGSGRTRSRRPADAARDATGLSQTGLAGTRARGSSPQPPRSRGRKRVPIVLSVTQTCRRGCRSRCSPDRGRDERGEVERSHTVLSYPRRRGGGQRREPLCTKLLALAAARDMGCRRRTRHMCVKGHPAQQSSVYAPAARAAATCYCC